MRASNLRPHRLSHRTDVGIPRPVLSSPGEFLACHSDIQVAYSERNDPRPQRVASLFSLLGLVFRRIFSKQLQTDGFVCLNVV